MEMGCFRAKTQRERTKEFSLKISRFRRSVPRQANWRITLYHVFEDLMHCQLSLLDVKTYHVRQKCVSRVLAVCPDEFRQTVSLKRTARRTTR